MVFKEAKLVKTPKLTDIVVAITEQCATNCDYCFYYKNVDEAVKRFRNNDEAPLSQSRRTLTLDTLKRIITEAMPLGLRSVQISGGEPLLRKKLLVDTLTYCSTKKIDTTLYTNGTLTDSQTIDSLVEAGLLTVRISLGGYSYETHSQQRHDPRGIKDWENIVDSISQFSSSGINTSTLTPITRISLPHLGDTGRFASALGAKFVTFHMYIPSGISEQDKKNVLTIDEHYQAIEEILELREELGNMQVKVIPNYGVFEYLSGKWNKEMEIYPSQCGETRLGVFADGSIGSCTCTSERLANIQDPDFDLKNLWTNNDNLNAIRKQRNNPFDPCNDCIHQDYCRPCRSYTFNLGKEGVAPQSCPAVKDYQHLLSQGVDSSSFLQQALGHNLRSKL